MTVPVKTERARVYDFVKRFDSKEYCFDAVTIKNTAGVALDAGAILPGTPLLYNTDHYELVAAGSVSGMDAFFADDQPSEELAIGATSTKKYQILKRGPAIVNLDQIPADLYTGAAFNLTTVADAIAAFNPPIEVFREPETSTTQTT